MNPAARLGAALALIVLALYLLHRYGAVIVPLLMLWHAARSLQARPSPAVVA
jgi:hypothetical protein